MAWSIGVNNPFLRSPGAGAAETAARGAFYGAKVRTGAIVDAQRLKLKETPSEPKLYWVYGKKTWANCSGLGFPSGKLNITDTGMLALYNPRSNVPLLPILTGVDTSNEGAMGSVIKATVSFTMYPSITETGVILERIQSAFFTPGANIACQFGWSTYAAVACASRFGFNGKVVSFSWSVGTDVSVTASTSVIAPGAIATGVSTNMQKATPSPAEDPTTGADGTTKAADANANGGEQATFNPLDPKAIPVAGTDLATVIDKVMAKLNPIQPSTTAGAAGEATTPPKSNTSTNTGTGEPEEIYGIKAWEVQSPHSEDGLKFIAMGIPWMPEPPQTDEVTPQDEAAVAAANAEEGEGEEESDSEKKKKADGDDVIKKFQDKNNQDGKKDGSSGKIEKPIVKKFWYVNFGSMETFLSPLIEAATKGEIKKVDIANDTLFAGAAGYMSAYPMEVIWNGSEYGGSGTANPGPSAVRASSPIGGIWFNTDFVKELWRRYFNDNNTKTSQKKLTQFLSDLCSRANEACGDFWQLGATVVEKFSSCGSIGQRTSVLAVEDFSYCPPVGAFGFNASFARPMLKNVSVSCKSSSTMGAAVMGGGNVDVPGKRGVVHGNPGGNIKKLQQVVEKTGINTSWGDAMKALLKLKKKADAAHHSKTMILFPIDFSVSIDGCSGWQFNEAVNTNLKPPGYGASRFAISAISNKIDASAWETSLTAMMRS